MIAIRMLLGVVMYSKYEFANYQTMFYLGTLLGILGVLDRIQRTHAEENIPR